MLTALADDLGVPVARVAEKVISAWVKEQGERAVREAFDRSEAARQVKEIYSRLIGQIAKIGNNLNQLARYTHTEGEITEEAVRALDGIWRELARIAQEWRPVEVLRAARKFAEGEESC